MNLPKGYTVKETFNAAWGMPMIEIWYYGTYVCKTADTSAILGLIQQHKDSRKSNFSVIKGGK